MPVRSEFSLIETFIRGFRPRASPRGPGDDCAVLPPSALPLCVTTDQVVEDIHFTLRHFSLEDIGHKALAVNLSDLAAMGARPQWFVCALALPVHTSVADVRALSRGMSALAAEHRLELAGGNFTHAAQMSIAITAAGSVAPGRALLRSGGHVGDALFVSGTLGDARLGLQRLGKSGGAAVQRQKRPQPRVRLGMIAARFASAAIDVSDGFAQDLGHLCAASGVGAKVELTRLPLSPALRQMSPSRARAFALAGGEDYELVLAVPPGRVVAFERACARAGEAVTWVGELVRQGGVALISPSGARLPVPPGFDHFNSLGRRATI